MVEQPTATRTGSSPDRPNTLLNVLVGAIVTVITAPLLPFAAIVGGAAAGYLQRGDVREGATVGALSGAVAAIPAFFVAWVIVGVFLLGFDALSAIMSIFAFVVFAVVVGYLVGAGALGGALGAYLRREL